MNSSRRSFLAVLAAVPFAGAAAARMAGKVAGVRVLRDSEILCASISWYLSGAEFSFFSERPLALGDRVFWRGLDDCGIPDIEGVVVAIRARPMHAAWLRAASGRRAVIQDVEVENPDARRRATAVLPKGTASAAARS